MKMGKNILLSLLAISIATPVIAGLSDHLSSSEIKKKFKHEIADLDVKTGTKLGDLDLFGGANLSAKYKYEVEASYKKGFHTRVDAWKMKFDLSPGDLIGENVPTPLYFNISKNSEVVFVRQFKSKKKALTALPYTLKHLPLTANRALDELKEGDFVTIPAQMTLAFGARAATLASVLEANGSAYYLMTGRYTIQVFRMKNDKVRLKLIALNSKAKGVSGGAEVDFKIFGISIVDKQIKKLVDLVLLPAKIAIKGEIAHIS